MLFDTHCHLDLIQKFGLSFEEVLENAKKEKVTNIIQISTDIESSLRSLELCEYQHDIQISCCIGLHPESVQSRGQIEEMKEFIKNHIKNKKVVGIGETGLDFFQNPETIDLQIESLYEHFKLAKDYDLPIVVHSRDDKIYSESRTEAIHQIYQLTKELNISKGILHCFTYSYKEAKLFIDSGWKVSFSGIVTFKNANFIQEAALKIPLENLLIETDAPFLAPNPKRGKTNQPAYVIYTAEFLGNLRKIPFEELTEILEKNSKEIFYPFIRKEFKIMKNQS